MPDTNLRLFNAATRHQVYLDGVKLNQFGDMQAALTMAALNVRRVINDKTFETLDELGKRELNDLLRDLREQQADEYDSYREDMIAELAKFAEIDRDLMADVYTEITGREFDPSIAGLYGAAVLGGSAEAAAKLWSTIANTPVPASGIGPIQMYDDLAARSLSLVENTVRRGWVERWNRNELLSNVIGSESFDFKDGVFSRINNNAFSVNNTAIAHTSSVATNAVASSMFDFYIWVSIIDGATTDICTDRDGNIYKYGEGPTPPAHYNCRSDIIPVENSEERIDSPPTAFEWIEDQPEEVQDDILGRVLADGVRAGKSSANELGRLRYTKPLTPEQFAAKRELILAE